MGTPEFAVPCLDILVKAGYDVVAVITAPDKPAGRGMQMNESAIKKYAVEQGIPVLQPVKLKDPAFIEELNSYNADLQIVVAFRMLPEVVWNMPPIGTFNLHASLLPDYRGAAPINWAVINGEKETGVSTFFLQHDIDTGDIILQDKLSIGEDETAGELHDRMMMAGAELVLKTVQAIENKELHPTPQVQTSIIKSAPKIFKDDCKINWNNPIDNVFNFIRGLSPYPAAWTMIDGKIFKIYSSSKEITGHKKNPASIETDGKKYLKIAMNGGYLHLLEVQMEGKKKMSIEDFLRGYQPKSASME